MNLKTCPDCGLTQEESKFPSSGWINGKQYRRRRCYKCYWLLEKKPRRAKRAEWLEEYKAALKCEKCGNDDFRVLEFHHRDKHEKSFNVSDGVSRGVSKETLLAELDKCECLCANCHRIVTYEGRT